MKQFSLSILFSFFYFCAFAINGIDTNVNLVTYQSSIVSEGLRLAKLDFDKGDYHRSIDLSLKVLASGNRMSQRDSVLAFSVLRASLCAVKAYDLSIDYGMQLLTVLRDGDIEEMYYVLDNLAYNYLKLHEFDSSDYYFERAILEAKKIGVHEMMHCYNNMSYGKLLQKKYDGAIGYSNLSIQIFDQIKEPTIENNIIYAIVLRGSGIAYAGSGDYDKAIELMLRSSAILEIYHQTALPRNYLLLANYHLIKNDANSAVSFLRKTVGFDLDDSDRLYYDKIYASYYQEVGKKDSSIFMLQQYITENAVLLDSKFRNTSVTSVSQFNTDVAKKEVFLQRDLRKKDNEMNVEEKRNIIIIAVLIIMILLLLSFKYFSDKKKDVGLLKAEGLLNEEMLKRKELEEQRLRQEVAFKEQYLTDFAIDSVRKSEFTKSLLDKIKYLSDEKDGASNELIEIKRFVKSQLTIDENVKVLHENINQQFVRNLEDKYPLLSKNEKQLCALLRLQLTSKEIATIKGIAPDSVKTMRYRIRKKLGLSNEIDLSSFLLTV